MSLFTGRLACGLGAVVLASLLASAAGAVDARLTGRLDAETASALEAVIDSARAMDLPTDPLVARALEGASRGAPGPLIVMAVRHLAGAMNVVREAIGQRSSSAELVAGAAALSAGVPADSLAGLRLARGRASLLVPLVVMADLVTRRVPVETASAAVLAASRARVHDQELMRLRARIDDDIRTGALPGNATILRTRYLIGRFEGPAGTLRAPGEPRGAGP